MDQNGFYESEIGTFGGRGDIARCLTPLKRKEKKRDGTHRYGVVMEGGYLGRKRPLRMEIGICCVYKMVVSRGHT